MPEWPCAAESYPGPGPGSQPELALGLDQQIPCPPLGPSLTPDLAVSGGNRAWTPAQASGSSSVRGLSAPRHGCSVHSSRLPRDLAVAF